ncbi:MAG: hypothetical protein WBA12_10310, partial [Catalinimonas sp.]
GLQVAADYHGRRATKANEMKDRTLMAYRAEGTAEAGVNPLTQLKNRYHNEALTDLVRGAAVKEKVLPWEGELLRQNDPIYHNPEPRHALDYRTHFFAPRKHLFGATFDTFWFNLGAIWLMSAVLCVTLYFETLRWVFARLEAWGGRAAQRVGALPWGALTARLRGPLDRVKLPRLAIKKNLTD